MKTITKKILLLTLLTAGFASAEASAGYKCQSQNFAMDISIKSNRVEDNVYIELKNLANGSLYQFSGIATYLNYNGRINMTQLIIPFSEGGSAKIITYYGLEEMITASIINTEVDTANENFSCVHG